MVKKKDLDEPPGELQKVFEEEMQKPYYKIDYLDDFKLPYEKLDVSVIYSYI